MQMHEWDEHPNVATGIGTSAMIWLCPDHHHRRLSQIIAMLVCSSCMQQHLRPPSAFLALGSHEQQEACGLHADHAHHAHHASHASPAGHASHAPQGSRTGCITCITCINEVVQCRLLPVLTSHSCPDNDCPCTTTAHNNSTTHTTQHYKTRFHF